MSSVRVALAQINPIMGNFDHNVNLITGAIKNACNQTCDLIIFPEMVLCGYPPEDLLLRQSFMEDVKQAMQQVTAATQDITAIVGYPLQVDGQTYNAAAIINNGRLLNNHKKIELPNYGVFDEKRYFSSGHQPLVFELDQLRFALTICEDIWISQGPCSHYLESRPIDYVINLAASPYHISKMEERVETLSRFSKKIDAAMIYVNLLGGQDELVFDGGSLILDKAGSLVAQADHFKENLLVVDLKRHEQRSDNEQIDLIIEKKDHQSLLPLMAQEKAIIKNGIDEIYHALLLGTKDYIHKNNFKKVIVGLSGGIDSAVTAAIAAHAIGAQNVVALSMPSQFSSNDTKQDAERCAKQLGLDYHLIPIQDVFLSYQSVLKDLLSQGQPGLELENIQARIRGNYLMALSNKYGYLVLTTGNKSETAVGYCTLYGDMAGGFSVIKDVYKTTVYELARHINTLASQTVIPESIITRAPSAELRADQKDEDSLPAYDRLDPILKAYIEDDCSPDEIIKQGYDQQMVLDIIRLVDRNEYKRRQASPGVKITPKAFGRDWRLPITNQYSTHLLNQFT